jgi:hypothetical protein
MTAKFADQQELMHNICVPIIAYETRIYRKDSQYQTLLLGPAMGHGSIKSWQSNKNT